MDNIQMWVYILFSVGAGVGLVLVMWLSRSKENIQTEQPKEYVPDSPVKELFDLLVLKDAILEYNHFMYNGEKYHSTPFDKMWYCKDWRKNELEWMTAEESKWLYRQINQHNKQREKQAEVKQREQVGRDIQEQLSWIKWLRSSA